MSLNKVILIGNIGKNPEIRSTQDGKEVAKFSLATSEYWKNKDGERKTKTEWHNVVVYAPGLISIIKKYLKTGSKVYIEGQVQTRKWKGNDGKDNYITEIVLNPHKSSLTLLDGKVAQDTSQDMVALQSNELDDEIPF